MIHEPKLENGIFEDTYLTSFAQTGTHGVITNKSLLSILENIAGEHSALVHYSFNEIMKLDLSWVILSWKLKVFNRIKPDTLITVKTWARSANKLFVLRDFEVFNDKGELCAIATSKWCLINISTGKIAKMPENIGDIYHGLNPKSVFNIEDFPKLLEPNSSFISEDTYRVRRFDLDLNKHVHNLNYLNIAYEILPQDIYDASELNNVEILYKKELKYNDTVKSYLYKDESGFTIVLKDITDTILHSIIKLY